MYDDDEDAVLRLDLIRYAPDVAEPEPEPEQEPEDGAPLCLSVGCGETRRSSPGAAPRMLGDAIAPRRGTL